MSNSTWQKQLREEFRLTVEIGPLTKTAWWDNCFYYNFLNICSHSKTFVLANNLPSYQSLTYTTAQNYIPFCFHHSSSAIANTLNKNLGIYFTDKCHRIIQQIISIITCKNYGLILKDVLFSGNMRWNDSSLFCFKTDLFIYSWNLS